MRVHLLAALCAVLPACRHASAACPAPIAELVADSSACVTVDVPPTTDVATVQCGSETVRGPLVDIHFPSDGMYGYGFSAGTGTEVRVGLIRTSMPACTGCGGVDSHTGVGFGGVVVVPFHAGDTLRLVLDADLMGARTWQVGVCPDGMTL